MLLPLLVIVFIAGAVVLRARGGRQAPDRLERAWLLAAPLPLLCVLVVPLVVSATMGVDGHSRRLVERVHWTGVGLSVVLSLAGLGLIARAVRGRRGWGWPLGSAVIVAAAPALIVAMTYALFALAGVLLR